MRVRRLGAMLGSETLVIVVAATYCLIVLVFLAAQVAQDTWLALVGGRVVADSGLPGDDVLTTWTHGVHWVDQQWLGQLAFYGLHALGGLKLVLLTHAALAGSAFALALTFARRRGGSTAMVARIGILALGSLVIVSTTVRTQSLGYLLFVAVLWLVATDSATPSRRVLWIAPLLVIWANVHGSVLLGAALVALSGAIFVVRGLPAGADQRRMHLRHGALVIAIGALAPLCSPYAGSLGSYFANTLFNAEFGRLVTEWMSPRPSIATVAFYVLGGLALWSIGRGGDRLTLFERLVLVLTLAASFSAIRNIIWFALAATMLVPVAIRRTRQRPAQRPAPVWFEVGLSCAALLAVVAAAVGAIAAGQSGYETKYPPAAADAVWRAAQRDRSSLIYADAAYADWLLWRHPSLAGRILFDARFELLSDRELRDIARFNQQVGPRWRGVVGDARILVLKGDRRPLSDLPSSADVLVGEGSFHQDTVVGDVRVLTRSPSAKRIAGPS